MAQQTNLELVFVGTSQHVGGVVTATINIISTTMSVATDFDDRSISIDHLVRQLEADTFDLDNSLEKFLRSRSEVLASQKRALARFEEELFQIEESTRVTPEMEEQRYLRPIFQL